MKYRPLGKTGLEVSEIGFGAWSLGGGWGHQDDSAGRDALRSAFELGINFFDTAYVYGDGHSEKLIGEALGDVRDRIVIASKIPPKTFAWTKVDESPVGEVFPADWIVECTERSLKLLGTDYLDVQQLHAWSDSYLDEPEWLEALTRLKKQGKIRHFGVSANDWNPYHTVRLAQSERIESIQVIYNLFEQRPAELLLPAAEEHGIGIIARVPFEEGLLTGKFRPGHAFADDDWRKDWMTEDRLQVASPKIEALEAELDADTPTLADLALKFVLGHPAISTVIPGMRTLEHVRKNVAVSEQPALTEDKLAHLTRHKWYHGWPYPFELKKD
ncbi:MAG: aldo/keto reductase [Planctomycetota bacterium]